MQHDLTGREFERHVRGALAALYDVPRLQTHPLARFAATELNAREPTAGRTLQHSLRAAIAALQPPQDGAGERASRIHRLLTLRYVDGLDASDAWQRLGIGKSEYHREHGRAIGAVASILRARWRIGDAVDSTAARAGTDFAAATPSVARPLTRLIGRQHELAEIKRMLETQRLVTLTGAGGCGKTRLAVELAFDLTPVFADRVYFVDLAALSDPALIPQVVLASVGGRELPRQPVLSALTWHLSSRSALVVFDNCEHLIGACANLSQSLLQACPELRVLATSREPLGVAGEVTWRVPSLAWPDASSESMSIEALCEYDAVCLFVDRARLVRPHFSLTATSAPAVAEVCGRLDGIPLAIELAASRLNVLSPEQLLARLDDRFQLLTGSSRSAPLRHKTLRAAVDWSYELLSDREKRLFARLAVFAGEFTLPAAEDVGSGDGLDSAEVFELLAHLTDKSLVVSDMKDGMVRYRLLETLRQYATHRLRESGEYETARTRHLDFLLRLAEASNAHLGFFLLDAQTSDWLREIEPEEDNVRAALEWSELLPDGVERGQRLAAALHWYWLVRGRFTEARGRLERLLERDGAAPAVRAQALTVAGYLAFWQGDFTAVPVLLEESRRLALAANAPSLAAFAQCGLGAAASGRGEHRLARSMLEAALASARDLGDCWVEAFGLHFLAQCATNMGDFLLATSLLQECIDLLKRLGGNRGGAAFSLLHLGRLARQRADLPEARSRILDGLRLFADIGDRRGIAYALVGMAGLAVAEGDMRHAAHLFGASDTLLSAGGPFLELALRTEHDRDLAAARAALGEDLFTTLWTAGRDLSLQQTIAMSTPA